MLELTLCSLLTILPDYLVRRYVQGKRFGKEITLYSVWYELRYGISACLILTISLITSKRRSAAGSWRRAAPTVAASSSNRFCPPASAASVPGRTTVATSGRSRLDGQDRR